MLSVLYKLLFFAIISYCRTIGGIGKPSFLISAALGCAVTGGSSSLRITATVTPVEPRFFCAPKNSSE